MRRLIPLLSALAAVGLLATACTNASVKQNQQAIQQRTKVYAQAVAQTPTPNISNFPRRKTLVDAVLRQSLPNHPWYVYVLGLNGNIVNYYVAKSVPVNDCDYLSSTQNWQDGHQLDAPSLEGIYQSQTGCNTLTFFDLATDAEIQITSMSTYVTDRPLKVDAAPIKVSGK